jgi:putative endonuclease
MEKPPFWVYILLCENGNYYTGYTNNLDRRYQEHLAGTAKCKYTRSFKPTKIAQSWEIFGEKSEAMRIEKYIKTLSKIEKEDLISNSDKLLKVTQVLT